MIDINLLPWREEQLKKERTTTITLLVTSIALSLTFTLIVYFIFSSQVSQQQQRNKIIESEITKTTIAMQDYNKIKKQKLILDNNLKVYEGIQQDRYQTVKIFNEVTALIPKSIYLSSFTREDNTITLSGESYTNQAIPTLVKKIDNSNYLNKPTISEITSNNEGGRTITEFKLNFKATDLKPKLTPLEQPKLGK